MKTYLSYRPHFSHPIAAAAFSIIAAFTGRTMVVYFTKRTDGERRRMVCYYNPQLITRRSWDPSSKQLLQVFDIEQGAGRFISMDAVEKIVIGGTSHYPTAAPAPATPPARPSQLAEIKAELDSMFY